MKLIGIIVAVVALSNFSLCMAQALDDYYVDLAPPDLSAFTLLGINTNQITRPTTIKELATGLLNAWRPDGSLSPGLAFEWSPLLQAKDLQTYQDEYWKRAITFTAGTVKSHDTARMAVGIKWTPFDDTNPLLDHDLTVEMGSYLGLYAALPGSAFNRAQFLNNVVKPLITDKVRNVVSQAPVVALFSVPVAQPTPAAFALAVCTAVSGANGGVALMTEDTIAINAATATWFNLTSTSPVEGLTEQIKQEIISAKKQFKENYWNGFGLGVNVGVTGAAQDSKWNHMQFEYFSTAVNVSVGPLPSVQVIALAQISQFLRSTDNQKSDLRGGARVLTGSGTFRVSLEGEYRRKEFRMDPTAESVRWTLGTEFELASDTWLELALGSNYDLQRKESGILTLTNLKYAIHPKPRFPIP